MKIEYFEFNANYGWGIIVKNSIDTETDVNYLSHTKDTVKYNDTYTDRDDEVQYVESSLTRNFTGIRNEMISKHKKKITELQNEINILSVDTFEEYQENIRKHNGKI